MEEDLIQKKNSVLPRILAYSFKQKQKLYRIRVGREKFFRSSKSHKVKQIKKGIRKRREHPRTAPN